MPDRETVALVLLGLALAWIVWMDVRPNVRRWRSEASGRHAITYFALSGHVYCESLPVVRPPDSEPTNFYANIFYVPVGNGLESGQTLRRVQARIFHFGEPVIIPIKNTDSGQIDIRHGEWAFLEVGKIVSEHVMGLVQKGNLVPEHGTLKMYEHNIPNGVLSFEISRFTGDREYGLMHQPNSPHVWSLTLVVSADDAIALPVRINIDMQNTKSPVSYETVS